MYNVTVWNGDGWVLDSSYPDQISAQAQVENLVNEGQEARIEFITDMGMTIL